MMPELWQRIPPDSDVVLYFGCGDGCSAEALRQQYPQMTVIGVETDPVLRAQAERHGFFVAEDAAAALARIEKLGCLVDAWILTRQSWQDATLSLSCRRSLFERMRPAATLVWEVASNQYWQHLLRLITGKPVGEIRHNVQEIAAEMQQFGVHDVKIVTCQAGTEAEFLRFLALLHPLTEALQIPAAEQEQRLRIDAAVLFGRYKAEKTELLSILAVLGEPKVCARVRIDEPQAFLATLPQIECNRFEALSDARMPKFGRLVWIWQRLMHSESNMVSLQRQLMGRRALTIQEWDDDPLHWEEHFSQSRFIELRSAHAIQTSTPALAEYLRQFNPEVQIFPNCIASLPSLQISSAPVVTVFFGALNRQLDWAPIMPTLNRVLHKLGRQVRMIVVFDREFFEAVRCEAKEFIPFCSYFQYRELLQQSDVALLPLLSTRFNRMKSDLKFIECAAWGTAALASPTVYADTVRHGETGLLYETEEQFQAGLEQLLEDTDFRQKLTRNAWNWVREHRLLSMHYRKRLRWYESLFARYDELTEAIMERVPELRSGAR